MTRFDLEDIKKYWCYDDILKNHHNISIKELKNNIVRIVISDKYGVDATFYVKPYKYDFDGFSISGFSVLDRHLDITSELEYTDTLNECIKGALYYYNTRY